MNKKQNKKIIETEKQNAATFIPIITKIINLSLSTDNFPLIIWSSNILYSFHSSQSHRSKYIKSFPTNDVSLICHSFLKTNWTQSPVVKFNDYLSSNSLLKPQLN